MKKTKKKKELTMLYVKINGVVKINQWKDYDMVRCEINVFESERGV